jgi:hypothetical protein
LYASTGKIANVVTNSMAIIIIMNKSQRIYLNTGDTGNQNQDKFIKVRLEQNVETLEFMSLSISTADVYQNFNTDYSVLVGRVNANNGNEKIDGNPLTTLRFKLKIPQHAERNSGFNKTNDSADSDNWRRQHFKFKANEIYSIARFHGTVFNDHIGSDVFGNGGQNLDDGFLTPDKINRLNISSHWNTGIIYTENNPEAQYPSNGLTSGDNKVFGANWMNFNIYLPQFGYFKSAYDNFIYTHSSTNFTPDFKEDVTSPIPYHNNQNDIAAGVTNTKWFARSDLHWTDFIRTPKIDIQAIYDNMNDLKGFTSDNLDNKDITLTGDYRNGGIIPEGWTKACPLDGGKELGIPSNSEDDKFYFYKGYGESNCIDYLFELGVI